MSGGAFNYVSSVLFEYEGHMEDPELEDLLKDFCKLLHDLEWYKSGDTSREDYIETVTTFKKKWFIDNRTDRLKTYIDRSVEQLKNDLYKMVNI